MFGLFKKKDTTGHERIVRLLDIFERLSIEADELFINEGPYSRAELRLFTMSAISIYIQAYGDLEEVAAQEAVDKFTEQAIASLIIKIPTADYGMIHDAFRQRFAEYADPIVTMSNVGGSSADLQTAIFGLMPLLDRNVRVDRPLSVAMIQGLKIKMPLTVAAGDVADVFKRA